MVPPWCRSTLAVAVLAAASSACGDGPSYIDSSDGLQVLFLGNSLTLVNDVPGIVQAMVAFRTSTTITVSSVTPPGAGLEDLWLEGSALDSIRRGGWDVVVLQQGPSATEGRPSLLEYSQKFATEIRMVGAVPALYMVWPAEERSFDFDGVSDSYRTAAELVDGLLFPAGEAWRAAWRRDSTIDLYGYDRFHASPSGSYLAALVMFAQLTGESPIGLPSHLSLESGRTIDVPEAWAPILQESAVDANRQYARQPAPAPGR